MVVSKSSCRIAKLVHKRSLALSGIILHFLAGGKPSTRANSNCLDDIIKDKKIVSCDKKEQCHPTDSSFSPRQQIYIIKSIDGDELQ